MAGNRLAVLAVLVAFAVLLGGCATGRKQSDLEMQGLRNQVSVLQTQLQSKDEEINALKESLNKLEEQRAVKDKTAETKSHPTARQIQTALKNAGYYSGVIDGKIGKQTREAIKAFQKANNLKVSGKAGKQTWNLLKGYLEKKVK